MTKKQIAIAVIVAGGFLLAAGTAVYFRQAGKKEIAEEERLSPAVLNIYNWEDYIDKTVLEDFEKEYGIKVNLEEYEDDELALSAVQSQPSKYDIIITSDDTVEAMKELRLLAPLDLANIPNLKNIGDEFKNLPFDPGNKYSVPYLWGTTGIAVNRKYVSEPVLGWDIFWNPKYKGRVSMLNNPREVIGAALKYSGYSLNSIDPAQLKEAEELLLKQKPFLRGYEDPIKLRDEMASDSADLVAAHMYNGDAIFAGDLNPNIEYALPKEGAMIWIDNLAVSRDSRNKKTAEMFINFILNPKIHARIANYVRYASPNKAAEAYIDPELLDNPAVYPPPEALEKCEFSRLLGEGQSSWNKIWAGLQKED